MPYKEEHPSKVKQALDKLGDAQLESLSAEEVRGMCSLWCCSNPRPTGAALAARGQEGELRD